MNKSVQALLFVLLLNILSVQAVDFENLLSERAGLSQALAGSKAGLGTVSGIQIATWPVTDHSFFSNRPFFQSASPEKTTLIRNKYFLKECNALSGALQIVPFGGRSGKSHRLNKWFGFDNRPILVVAEDLAAGNADPEFRDINAIHLNIQTVNRDFKSAFLFRPRQSFGGVGFTWRNYLHWRDTCDKRWWAEISTPVVYVKNDMRLTETIINPGTPLNGNVNTSVEEAFKGEKGFVRRQDGAVVGEGWRYGRVDGKRHKAGLGDIELKLGYDFLCEENCYLEGYIGGVIPTSNKPDPKFLFPAVIGNNFHGGIMWGGAFGARVWEHCDNAISIEVETNWRYLFRNNQTRSFGVRHKPWARYMLVFKDFADAQANTPTEGINVFTRRVTVRPRFNADLNIGFVYYHCDNIEVEGGYNVWWRQSERVVLKEQFDSTVAFANVGGGQTTALTINRAITIGENFATAAINGGLTQQQYTLNAIAVGDIQMFPATHPATMQHTVYASFGYIWPDRFCLPVFAGLGASYSFSAINTAMNRWMLWGKVGISI